MHIKRFEDRTQFDCVSVHYVIWIALKRKVTVKVAKQKNILRSQPGFFEWRVDAFEEKVVVRWSVNDREYGQGARGLDL